MQNGILISFRRSVIEETRKQAGEDVTAIDS